MEKNKTCPRDSIIIASLLHDICKTKYNFPTGVEYVGHGTRSVSILTDFIKFGLTDDEWKAIRFHMGSKAYLRTAEDEEKYEETKRSELWELIHVGDFISAGNYSKPTQGIVKTVMKVKKI